MVVGGEKTYRKPRRSVPVPIVGVWAAARPALLQMERVGSFGTPSQVLGELSRKLDALANSESLTADERRDLVAMQREIRELLDVYADDEAAAPHLRGAYERVSILLSRPSLVQPILFLTNEAANAIPEFIVDPGLHLRQHSLRAAVAPPEFSAADRAAGRPPSMSMCFVGDPFGTGPLLIQDSPTAAEYAVSQTPFEPPVAAGSASLPAPSEGEEQPLAMFATPSIAIVPRAQSDVPLELLSLARLRAEPTAVLVSILQTGAQALVQQHAPMLELQRALLPAWRAALSSGVSASAATAEDGGLPPESVVAAIAQQRAATVLGQRGMRQAGNDEALKLGAMQVGGVCLRAGWNLLAHLFCRPHRPSPPWSSPRVLQLLAALRPSVASG